MAPQVAQGNKLVASPASVYLDYPGDTFIALGISLSQYGSSMGVDNDPRLSAASKNNDIAMVMPGHPTEIVAGMKAGTTAIVYTLGSASLLVPVVNRATGVRGDLMGHGIVDLDDLAVIQGALNTLSVRSPVTGAVIDGRDLNRDGVIDEKDMEILKNLCIYKDCAPHP